MKSVRRETVIEATPERVWEVLTDFAAYPEWSSFIMGVRGSLEVGGRLNVRVKPPGGRSMTFRPTLVHVDPNRRLGWVGHLFVSGLFDGAHEFVLTRVGAVDGVECTNLLQRETFTGVLVPLFGRTVDRTAIGFEDFNRALKDRAECRTTHE